MKVTMRITVLVVMVMFCWATIASAALAEAPDGNGTLQWSTCLNPMAVITDGNTGQPVVIGSRVELWDDSGSAPLAASHIGYGYVTPQPGRVATNVSLPEGNYTLHLRVYNVPDPYAPGVESCVAIVGANGLGLPGIFKSISILMPQEVCFQSATIPTTPFDPTVGGCQIQNPLAVMVDTLTATALDDEVLVQWETVSEIDNRGFNLYRGPAADGPWTRLNDWLIPSQAPGSAQGFSYQFHDLEVTPGNTYFYLLESIDLAGTSAQYGPVSATYTGAPTAVGLTALAAQPMAGGGGSLAVAALALASLAIVAWRAAGKR